MQHFVSVIFQNKLTENKRDIVLETMINTAKLGLVENSTVYELFESENDTTVLRLPLAKPIKEKHQQKFVETLANKLFDKGHNNFEIELSVINEATLRRGSRGEEVRALQQQLGIPADGIFGPQTEQAVRAFQQRAGIQVDGIAGGQTQAALAAGGAPRNAGAARPATAPFTPSGGSATRTPPAAVSPQQPTTAAPQTSPRPQPRPAQPTTATPRPGEGPNTTALRQRLGRTDTRLDPQVQAQRQAQARQFAQNTARTIGGTQTAAQGTAAQASDQPVASFPNIAQAMAQRSTLRPGNVVTIGGQRATVSSTESGDNFFVDARGNPMGSTEAPAAAPAQPTGTGRGDGNAEVAQRREDAARAQVQSFVQQQVQELTRVRANIPDDALIRQITQAAVQQGLNRDFQDPAAMAQLIADTVPQVERTATPPSGQFDAPAGLGAGATDISLDFDNRGQAATDGDDQFARSQTSTQIFPQAPEIDSPATVDTDSVAQAAQQQSAFRQAYGTDTTGPDGLPAPFYNQYLAPIVDGDLASNTMNALSSELRGEIPPAVARTVIRRLEQWHGGDVATMRQDMQSLEGETDPDLVDQREALGTMIDLITKLQGDESRNESVQPRPKGAFKFAERKLWEATYGKTHNKDGSPKYRNFINESKMQEITFHDDDEFFEAYGVLWFNEDEMVDEAEYQGRKVKLGKPMAGDVKKFKVYVRNPKGNVVKVNFGQKGAKIKKSNPERRRSFRARHNCDNPGPRHKARYWSCRKW